MGVTLQTSGSEQQSNYRAAATETHMEKMMVSKAAMKFSQNHPAQHQKLLDVIQTVQTSTSTKPQAWPRHQGNGNNANTRQSWSSGMIFSCKKKEEQSK